MRRNTWSDLIAVCVDATKRAQDVFGRWLPELVALLRRAANGAGRSVRALGPAAPDLPRSARRAHQVRRRRLTLSLVVLGAVIAIAALSGGNTASSHRARAVPAVRAKPASVPSPDGQSESAREARAIDHVLTYTSYISRGSGRHRDIALTFDDGPGPYTPSIIRELRQLGVPATFFEIGNQLKSFSGATAEAVRDGFTIGDHTETHPMMAKRSAAGQRNELLEQAGAIALEGAPFPRLFRPPYGSFDDATLRLLHSERMLMVLWTVDTDDYRQPGVDAIIDAALSGARPGAIILMHDAGGTRTQTVAALPVIVRALLKRHYRLVSIPRLILDDPPPRNQPPPQNLSGD